MQSVQRAMVRGGVASLVVVSLWGAGLAQAQAVDRAAAEKEPKSKATLAIEKVAAMKAAGVPPGMGIDQFSLGDLDKDQVFTAVAPCRIADTRNQGGPIAAGAQRFFDVDGTTFTGQGGVNAPCGIPSGVASAVVMTITVTQTQGSNGFITAFRLGSPQPNASVLNWNAPNQNIANTTVVPVNPGAGNDFIIFAGNGGTQVVIDVVGYFAPPEATALQCQDITAFQNVITGVASSQPLSCPLPGQQVVASGNTFSPQTRVGVVASGDFAGTSGTAWTALIVNTSGVTIQWTPSIRCCRVPGR